MNARRVYLDSSALLKRYVLEKGTEEVERLFRDAYSKRVVLIMSAWNLGEAVGVLDRKRRRGDMEDDVFNSLKVALLGDVKRMVALGIMKLVPVHTMLLVTAWELIEKHHVYQADALQIASARYESAQEFYTADRKLHAVALAEGLNSILLGVDG
ncbi:type II toxin-antitoxin system VapC family toxin [Thermococcus celer]|uniref:Twitching motility protein PilT n=1 Tax=Thermococcus celer Vu 13 = JCM 8558 TaxID=1293037 RepID=A0A218P1G0_THECE|nr:type II toxin-antitoxin system VapC family toxin [Thermococcus celer]ASI98743.1 twitching motility protein PilT [Thermococcus celer Vu 13 = JCM 8558]